MMGQLQKRTKKHRATAVVEMAVVLPILLTLLFGIIEFGWTFMVYQSITNAAREGCRVAVLEGATDTDIQNRVSSYMSLVGLANNYTLVLQHSTTSDPTETVTVRVPYSKVSLLNGYFGSTNFNIAGKSCMRKEGS
ncbi:MAG: TadE family protein [Phycisphaerae bacterium]